MPTLIGHAHILPAKIKKPQLPVFFSDQSLIVLISLILRRVSYNTKKYATYVLPVIHVWCFLVYYSSNSYTCIIYMCRTPVIHMFRTYNTCV